jgi:hypothetical protein
MWRPQQAAQEEQRRSEGHDRNDHSANKDPRATQPPLRFDHLPNILFVHFANLKRDMPQEMRRIAQFLEIPIDERRWEEILEELLLRVDEAACHQERSPRGCLLGRRCPGLYQQRNQRPLGTDPHTGGFGGIRGAGRAGARPRMRAVARHRRGDLNEAVTLESPELPVSTKHELPATLGEVPKRDLIPQTLARQPPTPQRCTVPNACGILVHDQVGVLAGLLQREEAGEYRGVAFGGHAAVVVASDVAGHAVRQQVLFPASEIHAAIIPQVIDRTSRRGQN